MAGKIRIGISGGTFDPIHQGHLIIAEQMRERFSLHKVIFIPVGTPPHKSLQEVTPAHHRYAMVMEAVSSNPYFEVSGMEVDRQGYTYAVDTLTALRQLYGDDAELYYITGADVIRDLTSWRSIDKVFTMCEFIAVLRPGFTRESFVKEIEHLTTEYNACIHTAESSLIDISSTTVRERVRKNSTIKYMVPEKVEDYIIRNGLYKYPIK